MNPSPHDSGVQTPRSTSPAPHPSADSPSNPAFLAPKPPPTKARFTLAAVLLAVGAVGYFGYARWAEVRAKDQADAFCQGVKVGDAAADVLRRAQASAAVRHSLHWRNTRAGEAGKPNEGEQGLTVMFAGASPYSRQVCEVRALDGRVTQAQRTTLD